MLCPVPVHIMDLWPKWNLNTDLLTFRSGLSLADRCWNESEESETGWRGGIWERDTPRQLGCLREFISRRTVRD